MARKYGQSETEMAIAQGQIITNLMSPREKEYLLGVLMAKIILDEPEGVSLLSQLVTKTKARLKGSPRNRCSPIGSRRS